MRSHGDNVFDIIIVHVISGDAQGEYRCRKRKVILGSDGHMLRVQLAGKKSVVDPKDIIMIQCKSSVCLLKHIYK